MPVGHNDNRSFAFPSRIIHTSGFTKEDFEAYTGTVRNNALHSLGEILKAMTLLEIKFGDLEREVSPF